MSSCNLFDRMEAATALIQLSPPQTKSLSASERTDPSPNSTLPRVTSTESADIYICMNSSNAHIIPPTSHTICDDDKTRSAKMTALRENHLQAMREASGNAAPQSSSGDADSCSSSPPSVSIPHPHQVVTETKEEKEIFPIRLHRLLVDPTVHDAISWLPNGQSFVILRPDTFAMSVLPRYFGREGSNSVSATSSGQYFTKNKDQGVHKYPSFTRKLNRWGFRQVSGGPYAGAFSHDLFRRDSPELCLDMICQKSRKTRKGYSGFNSIDDMASFSSASTMTTSSKSGSFKRKRPYSATITVSTASTTANKSLPIKKRSTRVLEDDIPSFVSHRNNSSIPTFKNGMTEFAETTSREDASPVVTSANVARETLARHFHRQHKAFALQTLLENSQLAMEAAGIKIRASSPATYLLGATVKSKSTTPVYGAMTTQPAVIAATLSMPKDMHQALPPPPPVDPQVAFAEAATNELYKAYVSALSSVSS